MEALLGKRARQGARHRGRSDAKRVDLRVLPQLYLHRVRLHGRSEVRTLVPFGEQRGTGGTLGLSDPAPPESQLCSLAVSPCSQHSSLKDVFNNLPGSGGQSSSLPASYTVHRWLEFVWSEF